MLDYSVLNDAQRAALPKLKSLREDFYLAGGTALALQVGHRDSIDFDFFTARQFNVAETYDTLRAIFGSGNIVKTQEERGTLAVLADKEIRLSLLSYSYPLLDALVEDEYIRLASLRDIGCMKLSAIVSRSVLKDYVDLYVILNRIPLHELLDDGARKMPDLDRNLVLKSLVYFDDIQEEPINFKKGHEVSLADIRTFLTAEVRKVARPSGA